MYCNSSVFSGKWPFGRDGFHAVHRVVEVSAATDDPPPVVLGVKLTHYKKNSNVSNIVSDFSHNKAQNSQKVNSRENEYPISNTTSLLEMSYEAQARNIQPTKEFIKFISAWAD